MELVINRDKSVKAAIVKELVDFGCCNLCVLRYIGNMDAYVYRNGHDYARKFMFCKDGEDEGEAVEATNGNATAVIEGDDEPAKKVVKKSPCSVCLGLLDPEFGTRDDMIDKIVEAVKAADIQANSYTVNLFLPISVLFRAYFLWYRLLDKFPKVYEEFPMMKPESVCVKNAWKWICTGRLKERIDPKSDWSTDGNLMVNVALKYDDDDTECAPLKRQIRDQFSRINVDALFKTMGCYEFRRKFGDTPPLASKQLVLDNIQCSHAALYLAGRYNKYSRNVSQTPWVIDGKKIHEGSVEELIADHVLPLTQAEKEKFSASGREDVDVRMLGIGRPFLMEIINPKRTLFSQADMNALRDRINQSTKLIQVRDVQMVSKRDSALLKDGEESKTKNYCALCLIPNYSKIPDEFLDKLNTSSVPIVLQQKTPIRVLHRRSLMTRERSIYSMKAVPCNSKNMFKLYVKTQAGTYVKEFVHGDLGRTRPSVAEILGCDADIVSLDVESIDFPWPPSIPD